MRLLQAPHKIFCRYTNPTSRVQIIKITNIPNSFFERAVMPYGSVLFEAIKEARLEIHTSEMMGAILSDVIPCVRLANSAEERRQIRHKVPQTAGALCLPQTAGALCQVLS